MKKLIIGLMCVILLSGCSDRVLKESYDKMQIGKNIDSYQLDLKIYGSYDDNYIDESVRVDNYKNKQLKVDYTNKISTTKRRQVLNGETKELSDEIGKENTLYIIDGIRYRLEEGKYKIVEEETLYSNTDLYIQALNDINSKNKLKDENIAGNVYTVYETTISKDVMKKILDDSVLKEANLIKDVKAKVWLNKEGYIYQVIYYLTESIENSKNLEITATFFRINQIIEMKDIPE